MNLLPTREAALRRSEELCELCPKLCRSACPVSDAARREALTPWGKVSLAALTVGRGLAPDPSTALAFAGCTGCLRCTQHCAHANDVPATLYAARAAAVRAGTAPASWAQVAIRTLASGHAEAGDLHVAFRALERDAAALPAGDPSAGASPTPLLFAGCDALVSGGGVARRALAVAQAMGAPLGLAPEGALCCGLKLVEAGHPELFSAHAARVRAALLEREAGPSRSRRRAAPVHLVFLSPGCARTLLERYPAAGAALPEGSRVEHLSTYLSRALAARPDLLARRQLPGTVAFHDPCELARGLSELTAPRMLLTAALEGGVREPVRCGVETSCCGAGGLLPRTLPAVAAVLARERTAELQACGAPAVTASPGCSAQLGVGDVVDILARWLAV